MSALAMYTNQFIPSVPGAQPGAGFATAWRRIKLALAPFSNREGAP